MEIDFSKFDTLSNKTSIGHLQKAPKEQSDNTANKQELKHLQAKADNIKAEKERTLEIYRTYQNNSKISSHLQREILQGVKSGVDIYNLFLKACKAISLMTSDNVFYNVIEADIKSIYGKGLLEVTPLSIELSDTQKRLARLIEAKAAEKDIDVSKRLSAAIKAHKAKVEQLQNLINQNRGTQL